MTVTLEVFDLPMCCSSGVCGPEVDPLLVRFAADVKWLQDQGVEVRRHNVSQNPAAFVENDLVKQALTEEGEAALPMIVGGNKILSTGRYPQRDELGTWAGLAAEGRAQARRRGAMPCQVVVKEEEEAAPGGKSERQ